MNKLKFLPLLLPFLFIQAQELDEAYLASLPNDIKEDLLKSNENKKTDSEENYRASKNSSNLKQAEDLLDLKTRIEADLKELDKRLSSDENISVDEDLKLFGSDFFRTFQTSFMPINEPNPDSSYTLDRGDVLKIQLNGQKEFIETFIINGDGSINIPDIGILILAGLTLNEATSLIKSKVSTTFIGTDAYVNLDKIRDVNILVSGNAEQPGVYTLTGNSNILHALTMAGGINDFGSYREINLIRDKKIIEVLDVYDLLIDGNFNLKKRLRSGDVIFVESRKSIVSIDGAVKRPAKYELRDGQYLDAIIRYSTGIKQTADLQNIYLERILDGTLKSIPIVNISQFSSIEPIDGDFLYFREFSFRKAIISGAVLKPGSYIMANGETLEDLINKAGGYTVNAYPFGAVFENNDARMISKMANEMLYEEFLDNIITMSQQTIGQQNADLTPILSLSKELKNAKPNGRIIVDLFNEDINNALFLKEGDTILIPEKNNSVYVYGEVSSQGAVMFSANKGVDYFIEKSGGFKKYSDNASIYILHPNGETVRFSKKRNLFASQPDNITIYPGSIIFVPRKLDSSSSNRLASQAYVSILGNLGIALASLSSINNN